MGILRSAVAPAALIALVGLADCKRAPPVVEHAWEPYAGPPAFPNLRPKLALPEGDFALVPSSGADTITLTDLGGAKGGAVATVPVGRDPVDVDGPHQIVADRAHGVAYAVLSYPGSAENAGQHSHGASNVPGWVQVLSLEDLRPVGELRVDPNPGEIAVSDDGRKLVVTHFDLKAAAQAQASIDARRSTVAVMDPHAIEAFGTPEPDKLLVCVAPHGLALSRPNGAKAFVACYGEDVVAIVDLVDIHTPVVRVPVASSVVRDPPPGPPVFGPYAVALSPSGARVAVSNRDAKDVRFLDVSAAKMEPIVANVGGAPYFAAWSADGTKLYVPTRALDALVVVDAARGTIVRKRPFDAATCAQPLEVIVPADPTTLFVVCEGNAASPGAVLTLDAATLDVRTRTTVGLSPGRSFVGRAR